MKRNTGALPRTQARTCLPKRGNSNHRTGVWQHQAHKGHGPLHPAGGDESQHPVVVLLSGAQHREDCYYGGHRETADGVSMGRYEGEGAARQPTTSLATAAGTPPQSSRKPSTSMRQIKRTRGSHFGHDYSTGSLCGAKLTCLLARPRQPLLQSPQK